MPIAVDTPAECCSSQGGSGRYHGEYKSGADFLSDATADVVQTTNAIKTDGSNFVNLLRHRLFGVIEERQARVQCLLC